MRTGKGVEHSPLVFSTDGHVVSGGVTLRKRQRPTDPSQDLSHLEIGLFCILNHMRHRSPQPRGIMGGFTQDLLDDDCSQTEDAV